MLNSAVIIGIVAEFYGISVGELLSRKRARKFTTPRQVAMYLCRVHIDAKYTQLAKIFNRNHTTTMYAVENIKDNPDFAEIMNILGKEVEKRKYA